MAPSLVNGHDTGDAQPRSRARGTTGDPGGASSPRATASRLGASEPGDGEDPTADRQDDSEYQQGQGLYTSRDVARILSADRERRSSMGGRSGDGGLGDKGRRPSFSAESLGSAFRRMTPYVFWGAVLFFVVYVVVRLG